MVRTLRPCLPVFLLLLANVAIADTFVGAKLASADIDGPDRGNPFTAAFVIGRALDTWIADLSLVAEFSQTVADGKSAQGDKLAFNSNAVYLLSKSTRSMYFSLRGGLVQTEVVEAGDSDYQTGLLLGAGVGQVVGKTRVQIDYMSLAGEAEYFGISLEFDL